MERILEATADGSHTISIPELQVTYHSKHGAVQESMHVFIEAGLRYKMQSSPGALTILEMGFGTGLNALLSLLEAEGRKIWYESLEAYPVSLEMALQLNYAALLKKQDAVEHFKAMHLAAWNEWVNVTPEFYLYKRETALEAFHPTGNYDIVYFDAFAPTAQPELWTESVFKKLFDNMKPGGILVTYCSKGIVRRAMQAAGFSIEKIPGPPGKREMVRVTKPMTT
jgi:tRNA U34 5-methylaminomethyl-2-thiouridine-forming methyltransferase MnmC